MGLSEKVWCSIAEQAALELAYPAPDQLWLPGSWPKLPRVWEPVPWMKTRPGLLVE
jgi:hypothetical protein